MKLWSQTEIIVFVRCKCLNGPLGKNSANKLSTFFIYWRRVTNILALRQKKTAIKARKKFLIMKKVCPKYFVMLPKAHRTKSSHKSLHEQFSINQLFSQNSSLLQFHATLIHFCSKLLFSMVFNGDIAKLVKLIKNVQKTYQIHRICAKSIKIYDEHFSNFHYYNIFMHVTWIMKYLLNFSHGFNALAWNMWKCAGKYGEICYGSWG